MGRAIIYCTWILFAAASVIGEASCFMLLFCAANAQIRAFVILSTLAAHVGLAMLVLTKIHDKE